MEGNTNNKDARMYFRINAYEYKYDDSGKSEYKDIAFTIERIRNASIVNNGGVKKLSIECSHIGYDLLDSIMSGEYDNKTIRLEMTGGMYTSGNVMNNVEVVMSMAILHRCETQLGNYDNYIDFMINDTKTTLKEV